MKINDILQQANVIPVLVIDDINKAVPLAEALVAGGLKVLEVTLRTPQALAAISEIKKAVPSAIVGAGTVLKPEQFEAAAQAGAAFVVSPGLTPALHTIAEQLRLPYLPGAVTPSEIMIALTVGYRTLKFFPAEANGGITTLKAYQSVFPEIKFCPTGGIKQASAAQYLALDNVITVGGSWFLQDSMDKVTELAKAASGLR